MRTAKNSGLWKISLAAILGALALVMVAIGYLSQTMYDEIAPSQPARSDLAAVVFSGDMGFRIGMSPKIAARLAAARIPVLGVNSLTFARRQRSRPEIQALVAGAVRRALAFGHAQRLVLIGQSFGADMLHVGLAGLPPGLRDRIALIILVVPTDKVYFNIGPREYFEIGPPDQYALATARLLDWAPVTCIRGADETDSLCPALGMPNVRRVVLPGGHPLHRDADTLFAAIRDAIAHHGR